MNSYTGSIFGLQQILKTKHNKKKNASMLKNGEDGNEKINLCFFNNFRGRYRPIHTDAVLRVYKVYKVFKVMALLSLRLSLEAILNNVTQAILLRNQVIKLRDANTKKVIFLIS